MHILATKLTNARNNSCSTNRSTKSHLCSISGSEPSATYFKVQNTERKPYLLRYDEQADEWTLQSGFDGDELLARPSIELVTVDADVIGRAEKEIESCEHCHPEEAEIPFDWLLAEVSGRTVMLNSSCANRHDVQIKREINEKTLVEPKE